MSTITLTAEPGSTLVTIARDFRATPAQLLRAYTDPALFAQWQSPGTMTIEAMEVRHGGTWRWSDTRDDGNTYTFHGVYHNQPSVEHGLTQTFEFEGAPDDVSLERVTFEDLGGGTTRLHARYTFTSVAYRDMLIEHGMYAGVEESYDRLASVLVTR